MHTHIYTYIYIYTHIIHTHTIIYNCPYYTYIYMCVCAFYTTFMYMNIIDRRPSNSCRACWSRRRSTRSHAMRSGSRFPQICSVICHWARQALPSALHVTAEGCSDSRSRCSHVTAERQSRWRPGLKWGLGSDSAAIHWDTKKGQPWTTNCFIIFMY